MTVEQGSGKPQEILGAPAQNFARGLLEVNIPELGPKTGTGKVRDIWVVGGFRIMATTDRQSAFDRMICTTPGKGRALNLLSAFWFKETRDIVPNHLIWVLHPNILIAKQAKETLPIEVVVRRYMARSSSSTSVYHNYTERERRKIYGIEFPGGLKANQEFPMGTIVTPTTKALTGHDQELTDGEARGIADSRLGDGTWAETKEAALLLFERARAFHLEKGLILVDTKYEFGIDGDGKLMLIDEIHTPDSSRFWLAATYRERFEAGENPETFDKEILRRWLADHGFRGEGAVPVVDPEIIDQMARAYRVPYAMVTGEELPEEEAEAGKIKEIIKRFVLGRSSPL